MRLSSMAKQMFFYRVWLLILSINLLLYFVLIADIWAPGFIFSLGPNAELPAQVDIELENVEEEYEENIKLLDLINGQLRAFASCNRDERLKYEAVGVINAKSWARA
jgi:hypothetical protein